MTHFAKRFLLICYGIYAWTAFLAIGSVTLLLLLVLPTLALRRWAGSAGASTWLRVAGVVIHTRGQDLLPEQPAVLVANHSSYVDGVLLEAVLPARYSFVIKKEMARVPVAGLLLRRIGAEFVDRFNRHSGAMDARRIMRSASAGTSLVFFPEGTFTGKPGLAHFHGGAFTIAARSNMPVVPVAIRGARNILRGGTLLPRPGHVHIEVLPVVPCDGATPTQLRDLSRARILLALDEPDLINSDGVAALAMEKADDKR